jgi:hypothetical protein
MKERKNRSVACGRCRTCGKLLRTFPQFLGKRLRRFPHRPQGPTGVYHEICSGT